MSSSEMNNNSQNNQNQFLRQRRARILQDQVKEYNEEQHIRRIVENTSGGSSKQIWKIYGVILLALIVTLISAIQYTRPHLLLKLFGFNTDKRSQQHKKDPMKYEPYYMATLFPPNVILDRDLPRFFGTYSIATPDNEFAIKAVQNVHKSRLALKKGTGKLKVWLKAWDDYTIQQLLDRNICGSDFTVIYNHLSADNNLERKEDLMMWCILTTRLADGFFLDSIEIIEGRYSPLLLTKKRGMIVKKSSSSVDNNKHIHSLYVHPRNLNYTSTLAILPSKILNYLLDDAQQSIMLNDDQKNEIPPSTEEYRLMLQSHIHDMVMANNNIDNYLELTEICVPTIDEQQQQQQHAEPPIGAIAKTKSCTNYDEYEYECCYFVLPEPEAHKYVKKKDDDEDE